MVSRCPVAQDRSKRMVVTSRSLMMACAPWERKANRCGHLQMWWRRWVPRMLFARQIWRLNAWNTQSEGRWGCFEDGRWWNITNSTAQLIIALQQLCFWMFLASGRENANWPGGYLGILLSRRVHCRLQEDHGVPTTCHQAEPRLLRWGHLDHQAEGWDAWHVKGIMQESSMDSRGWGQDVACRLMIDLIACWKIAEHRIG